jgi:hypothetical protein
MKNNHEIMMLSCFTQHFPGVKWGCLSKILEETFSGSVSSCKRIDLQFWTTFPPFREELGPGISSTELSHHSSKSSGFPGLYGSKGIPGDCLGQAADFPQHSHSGLLAPVPPPITWPHLLNMPVVDNHQDAPLGLSAFSWWIITKMPR